MDISLSFETAQARHARHVAFIRQQQRASRSKFRLEPLANLKWSYSVAERIVGHTFGDVIANAAAQAEEPEFAPAKTFAERAARIDAVVERRLARTICHLVASKRQTDWLAPLAREEFPPELIARYRDAESSAETERERLARLTPEEQEAEAQAAMRELTRMPGMVHLRVPVPRSPRRR